MNLALLVVTAFLALSFALGLLARRGRTMNLEQWSVGGRGFGAVFVFLAADASFCLLAGILIFWRVSPRAAEYV